MSNILSFLLTLPFLLWSIFQPALYTNAMLIDQALANVIYETQKEASLKGRYDEELYKEIKDRLGDVYRFDTEQVTIRGTEIPTKRGERIYIEIEVPRPNTTVLDFFKFDKSEEPYRYKKSIMSEYVE